MSAIARFWLLALLLLLFGLLAGNAHARPFEECNPRNEDFWQNLGCSDEWEERIQRRTAVLQELRDEHSRLLQRNASLRDRIAHEKEMIAVLSAQIAEINRELDSLRQVIVSRENMRQVIATLKREAENIVIALDVATRAELGCRSDEFEAALGQAKNARESTVEIVDELATALDYLSTAADVAALIIPHARVAKILERLARVTGLLSTLSRIAGYWLEKAPVTVTERPRCDQLAFLLPSHPRRPRLVSRENSAAANDIAFRPPPARKALRTL